MINDIIKFYKTFKRYSNNSDLELYYHLKQSIDYNQYKLFKDNSVYGFCNWAYVNQEAEQHFLKTGIIHNWNCGNIMLHIDFIATKNIREIMSWLKNNATKIHGANKKFKWIRLNNNNKVKKIMSVKTKDSWLWVQ